MERACCPIPNSLEFLAATAYRDVGFGNFRQSKSPGTELTFKELPRGYNALGFLDRIFNFDTRASRSGCGAPAEGVTAPEPNHAGMERSEDDKKYPKVGRHFLMRKILLLVNPLFEERRGRDLPRILETFRNQGATVELEETGVLRAAGEQARRASAEGLDAVVVCGGDGTVFEALQGLAGSQTPLGIVPFGTGNVLAQNLKIPKDPAAVVQWLLSSRPVPIPLGRISCCPAGAGQAHKTWYFAMSAGMGLHASLMAAAQGANKKANGRQAYYTAGLKLLFQHPLQPFDIEITTPENAVLRRQVCEAIVVRVAELNFWRPGGGLTLPFLRVATVEGSSRWRLMRASLEAFLGAPGPRGRPQPENRAARYEDAIRIVCRPIPGREYPMPLGVEADGEVLDFSCAVIEMAGTSVNLLAHAL
jgi:diacylglycerol kinase family enzyme